jgi:isoleucyl-tRNA synthetase
MKQRQPLRRALLLHPGTDLSEDARQEIREELNVRDLEDVESLAGLMTWTVVPNFRALGPRLGARVNQVKAALSGVDGGDIRRALDEHGYVEVAGERLEPGDLELRAGSHEGYAVVQDQGWAVALDLELDDDLRNEGVARELARELNELRKSLDLALTDRIALVVAAGPKVTAALGAHRDWVAGEALARSLEVVDAGSAGAGAHQLEIDGELVEVGLQV